LLTWIAQKPADIGATENEGKKKIVSLFGAVVRLVSTSGHYSFKLMTGGSNKKSRHFACESLSQMKQCLAAIAHWIGLYLVCMYECVVILILFVSA
jgi:hypothetical protein